MRKKSATGPGVLGKSRKVVEKELLQKELGGKLKNDRKRWSGQDLDRFLDMWLANIAEKSIFKALGRSASAVSTILWKIISRYKGLEYTPIERQSRVQLSGWNEREEHLISLALSKGHDENFLAILLDRHFRDVVRKVQEMMGTSKKGFFPKDKPVPKDEHSGHKYLRTINNVTGDLNVIVDVYCVLEAFHVTCPAVQHAVKKLLCAGLRGKGNRLQDLKEASDAVDRAYQMEADRLQ